jgi:TRAP-type C4-dicarboxylate transport system permease small subunit
MHTIDKVHDFLKKAISPVSMVLAHVGIVSMVMVILFVVTDVFLRRVFNRPIYGSRDVIRLAFSIVVFLPQAWCALKNGHIELDFLVNKFPKAAQRILEVIMMSITVIILVLMSWRLWLLATVFQASGVESGSLEVPLFPFTYSAALGSTMLALAFFLRFLRSISNLTKEPR